LAELQQVKPGMFFGTQSIFRQPSCQMQESAEF